MGLSANSLACLCSGRAPPRGATPMVVVYGDCGATVALLIRKGEGEQVGVLHRQLKVNAAKSFTASSLIPSSIILRDILKLVQAIVMKMNSRIKYLR